MDPDFTANIHPTTIRVHGHCPHPLGLKSLLESSKGPDANEFSTKQKKILMFTKGLSTFWKHMAPDYNYYFMLKRNEIIQLKSCNIINI